MSKTSRKSKVNGSVRNVPYARGFKCPSAGDQISAIGFKQKTIATEYTDNSDRFFKDIPHPTSIDDWLAQYNEDGQTYLQYLEECPWLFSRKVKYIHQKFVSSGKTLSDKYPDGKIYIVPVGEFDEENFVSFNSLLDFAARFLCLPVVTLPNFNVQKRDDQFIWLEEPSNKIHARTSPRTKRTHLDSRFNTDSGNIQIQIGPLLRKLRQNIPQDALCLIGLTQHDLYGDDTDLFVAGMASGNERVAIFSLNRYDPCLEFSQEFWFKRFKVSGFSADERKRLILQRSCKLVVHEICHLLGIAHCIFYDCCMNGSGHLDEDFRQPMNLCPVDLRKLQTLTGFSVIDRYKKLKEFYQNYQMEEELQWIGNRIKYLTA